MRRIVASPEFPEDLVKLLSEHIESWIQTAPQQYWTHKRSTVVYQLIAGHEMVIKRYNAPTWQTRLKRILGPSPALKSYRNALKLLAAGLRTPRPIASFDTAGPVSYLITAYVDGPGADKYFADETVSDERKRRVAERILAAVRQLHMSGFAHKDLKARNILIADEQPCFIDLDSLYRPWLPWRRRRAMSADCARLESTLPALLAYGRDAPGEDLMLTHP